MLGYLGDTYFSGGKTDEAEEAYQRAVKAMPKQIEEGDQRSAVTFLNLLQIADRKMSRKAGVKALFRSSSFQKRASKGRGFRLSDGAVVSCKTAL